MIFSSLDRVRAPPRASSERVAVKGLFPGALVVRGHNWRWGDQDGRELSLQYSLPSVQ